MFEQHFEVSLGSVIDTGFEHLTVLVVDRYQLRAAVRFDEALVLGGVYLIGEV